MPWRSLGERELPVRTRRTGAVLYRPVRLVTFHSKGLVRLGLTASDAHGAYDVCGRWARALWTHPDHPDGIEYRSRHDDGEFCIALFDRASDVLEQASVDALMADPHRVRTILRRYGVRLTR